MNNDRQMSRCLMLFVALLIAAGLSGCQMRRLVFATYTKGGLDVTFADTTPGQIVFGYKRFEGAIVPVAITTVDKDDENTENNDDQSNDKPMAALFAAVKVDANWADGLKIYQDFATGDAAKQAAQGK